MAQLTEWLKLMVAEINRKREDADRAQQEDLARQQEPPPPQPTRPG
jgi:hypothetical protein